MWNGFPVSINFPTRLEGYFVRCRIFVHWKTGNRQKDFSYWNSPKKWQLEWTATCCFTFLIIKFLISSKPCTIYRHMLVIRSSRKLFNKCLQTRSSAEIPSFAASQRSFVFLRAADFVIAKHQHCAVGDRKNIEINIKRIRSSTKPTISSSNIVLNTCWVSECGVAFERYKKFGDLVQPTKVEGSSLV